MLDFPKHVPTLLVLVAGLASATFGQAPTTPAPPRRGGGGAGGNYKAYDEATLERGKQTYTANCAFCHGGNAKGGETGPDLLRSVTVLDDENGDLIGKVVLNGRPDKGMPKFSLTPAQISDIAAFLHEGIRAAAQRGTYKILDILVGDPKAGEAYFNGAGTCTRCHSVTGDLAHVGSKYDPVNLQQKIVMPRESRLGRIANPGAKSTAVTAAITLPSGEVVQGPLVHIDDFEISITDQAGNTRKFERDNGVPKVELHDPLQAHIDLLRQYTDADIHNLTAYLVTLK